MSATSSLRGRWRRLALGLPTVLGLKPRGDVDILLNRVLPMLPAGVLIHSHDIFLPFDYPPIWGWRAYNEQQGVVPLLASEAYRPLFSSAWAERRLGARLGTSVVARLPRPPD